MRRLETLRRATGADELLVTTATHDADDARRSFALLAEHWFAGAPAAGDTTTATPDVAPRSPPPADATTP